jgi:hypothetical protein
MTSHGFYVPAHVDSSLPEQRILERSVLLPPDGAVTGWAALRLRGARFFDGLMDDGATERPVPLISGVGQSRRPHQGVSWVQDRLNSDEWSLVQGIPATLPERALFDEVRRAKTLTGAVVSLDMAFAAELTSLTRMQSYIDAHEAWTGVPLTRTAHTLADENSRSPFESRARVVWVVEAGLPRPLVNQDVFDKRTGALLGIVDLLDPVAGLACECDGGEHARAKRRSRDAERDERFRTHRLETVRITPFDEHQPGAIRDRIRSARRRAAWEAEHERSWTTVPPDGWHPGCSLDEILAERDMIREARDQWEWQGMPSLQQVLGPGDWR